MGVSREQEWRYWDDQATAARRGQLAAVQQAASGWRTLFGALLGVFTAAAFAGGLTTLDKLASPWAAAAKAATLTAVAAVLSATYLANTAAQATSLETLTDLAATDLMERSHRAAKKGKRRLRAAKAFGYIAIGIVVVGSAAVLLIGPAPPTPPNAVVVVDGTAVCGKLTKNGAGELSVNGVALTASGTPRGRVAPVVRPGPPAAAGSGVTSFAVVGRCP